MEFREVFSLIVYPNETSHSDLNCVIHITQLALENLLSIFSGLKKHLLQHS